ncbi:GNAT family N-acetyltransferase [Flexivirga sp. ID2601S]|uniref:GNAT family N-acetyltransferase n=1 Tax=Flexivirga aerilata TaxID=1656889 RepID=A0A849AXB1_9MICO|nr:GNAT family N-acetyltransferase [Flexivirga aerilata]
MNVDQLIRAASASFWVPPESEHLRADGFDIVRYDNGFVYDTGVYNVDSERPATALIADAEAIAREWQRPALYWHGLSARTRPAALVDALLSRGAEEKERLAVLVLDLTAARPDLEAPVDITTEPAVERRQVEDFRAVESAAFETPLQPVTDEQLAERRRAATDGSGEYLVGYLDGRPVSTGGTSYVAGGAVAKLWGGATDPSARGRGAYRAVLDARLRAAAERGCRLAFVEGRVSTSAPILRRAGFTVYDEVFMLRQPVTADA